MTSRPLGSTRLGMSAAGIAATDFATAGPDDWICRRGLIADGVPCPASGAINERMSARVTRIRFTLAPVCFPESRLEFTIAFERIRCRARPNRCQGVSLEFKLQLAPVQQPKGGTLNAK